MKFNEGQINPVDAKAFFKVASSLRDNPTGLSKVFKGLRKDKVDVNDLQQAWKDEGFPDDTRDLAAILKCHGFSKKEIDKVFKEVFGDEGTEADPVASPTIQKIVDYAKQNGIVEELKAFMQKEYGFKESYPHEGKVVVEDIRQIFMKIIQEERIDRDKIIKSQDNTQLGRNKK